MPIHSYADLQAIPPKRMWQLLRTMRHSPPGRAGSGAQRETFDAAMEQAEQLFLAAQSVGTATRPLLLFYGVAQLGRAVAAASMRLDNDEYKLSGHGLKDGPLSVAAASGLAAVTIRGLPKGSFPVVARALGASPMADALTLGELWGLIPDGDRFPLPGAGGLQALTVELPPGMLLRTQGEIRCEVYPVPLDAFGGQEAVLELMRVLSLPNVEASIIAEQHQMLRRFLASYPGLSDAYAERAELQPIHFTFADQGSALRVPLFLPKSPEDSQVDALAARTHVYHGVASSYPSVDWGGRPAHPFMIWWAVLYVLSRLARYEPRDWSKLISVSGSADAAPVEYLLDEAQSALPELAYAAIDQAAYP